MREMADYLNTLDLRGGKETKRPIDGERSFPPISSTLVLDSLLKENDDPIQGFELSELSTVTELSIKDNNLFKLPLNFDKNLSNLTKINLSFNNLEEIEPSFKALINLRQLIVDRNRLIKLPSFIGELNNLRLISARGNKLAEVPESLGNLVDLDELDLGENEIKSVSDSLGKLDNLRILKFCSNELRIVPNCLVEGLRSLETLDLSYNLISKFNAPFFSKNLRRLYLNNNSKNDQFPDWLFKRELSNLEELVVDETPFTSFHIPKDLPVSHLRRLSMAQCGLSDNVFQLISQSLVDLEHLNVGNNSPNRSGNIFWLMPAQNLNSPWKLEELSIQGAGLPAIPREIDSLLNLTRLNVSRNNISSLPEAICELKRLELINAAQNNLYALPQSIGKLTSLKVLFLETNRLSSLPDSIEDLTQLELLDLYNNEFLQVPERLGKMVNLKALDIDGNGFKPDNLMVANIEYLEARNILRSTSRLLLLRSNGPKVCDESVDASSDSILCCEDDLRSEGNKSLMDADLSDVNSVENWDISEDSADEFDPTVQPRSHKMYSPFTVSSVFYYGNFCPADIHNTRVKDQLAAMERGRRTSSNIEEGQFDDA